jgi:hypothetical protein
MCRAVRRRLGRRGTALALLGIGKVLYGLGFILAGDPEPDGLQLLTHQAALASWAWIWVGCGAVAFACAWLRVGRDLPGFIAALIPPFIWGCAYLWSAVAYGQMRGLAVFGWYATSHFALILWAASVPEHSVPHPRSKRGPA